MSYCVARPISGVCLRFVHNIISKFIFLFCVLWANSGYAETSEKSLRIGVLAHRGADVVFQTWMPTAKYLESELHYEVSIVPLELYETWVAAQNKWIDLLLTNPGNFVELSEKHELRLIASLKSVRRGIPLSKFGATIFTRSDRNDIDTLEDLRGKSFMGVKQSGFGGFQLAWGELLNHGIDPFRDFSRLQFSGYPQDAVAYAVRDRTVDVGVFRTDTLEAMADKGSINLRDFKVINQKVDEEFPFLLSTELYPEWSIAAFDSVDEFTFGAIKKALLNLPVDSEAARVAEIAAWTEPLDHAPVHRLFQKLRIGPYSREHDMNVKSVVKTYWLPITSGLAIFLFMVVAVGYVVRINRRLDSANEALALENKERIIAEAALRDHRDHLGEIVRARTADLEAAHQAALLANRAKSRFLASMSHELRTPLNAIIGYSELLLENGCDLSQLDQMKDLRKVHSAGNYLLSLVNGMLDLSKIEAGRMEVHVDEEDLNSIADEIIATIKPLADKNQNELVADISPGLGNIQTDTTKLRQILFNVLSNACKFTNQGKIIFRARRIEDPKGDYFRFNVEDSGIGIPAHFLDRLFDPFSQADPSLQHKYGGTGLGLALTKRFCDLLGGTISMQSTPSRGTQFEIVIPVSVPNSSELNASNSRQTTIG